MIIVIDGPAGSGKSSTAKALANRLGINFLDSGALYRALTYTWIESGKPDKNTFFKNLLDVRLHVEYSGGQFKVTVNDVDVTDKIRTSEVSNNVSEIASFPNARTFANNIMRELVKGDTYIADGRDLGTAVFPDADLKFFMDASIEDRAKRRFDEIKSDQKDVTYKDVLENLKMRDHKDQNRTSDPLRKADDAILINTSGKTFMEQVDEMSTIINEKLTLN
ncbi:MAG: (d)CMP kinase [Balneolaceae bacterium]